MSREPLKEAALYAARAAEAESLDDMPRPDSQPVAFLARVWRAWPRRSFPQINRSMRRALEVAVMSGMKFEEGDISKIARRYHWRRWAINAEAIYAMAALGLKSHTGRLPRNTSAAKSFEHHWKRPAYFLNGVRLVIGSRFGWEGDSVTVTNIFADRLIACSYQDEPTAAERAAERVARETAQRLLDDLPPPEDVDAAEFRTAVFEKIRVDVYRVRSYPRKVRRRFSITASELRAAQRREKDAGNPSIWRSDPDR